MRYKNRISGFSEIELVTFIVLVTVIVILVRSCGDVAHKYSIHSDIAQITEYRNAISEFKGTYGQLPGDFSGAKKLWADCADIPSRKVSCDGNNNGMWDNNEGYYVFEHLSRAGLLKEKYSAVAAGENGSEHKIFPMLKITGQSIVPVGAFPGNAQKLVSNMFFKYELPVNSFMIYFESDSPGDQIPTQKKVETLVVKTIDTKMDDGVGATGDIRAAYDRRGFFGSYKPGEQCVTSRGEYKDDEDNLYYCSFMVKY